MKLVVEVKGKDSLWSVEIPNQEQADAMVNDGFEVFLETNSIPLWAYSLGLTTPWFFVQDLFNIPSWISIYVNNWRNNGKD